MTPADGMLRPERQRESICADVDLRGRVMVGSGRHIGRVRGVTGPVRAGRRSFRELSRLFAVALIALATGGCDGTWTITVVLRLSDLSEALSSGVGGLLSSLIGRASMAARGSAVGLKAVVEPGACRAQGGRGRFVIFLVGRGSACPSLRHSQRSRTLPRVSIC